MGQICKLPTVTPQIDVKQSEIIEEQQEHEQPKEEQKLITENNNPSQILQQNQFSMQLSCTPELCIQPAQSKQYSQQDSQYTPEFLAASQPFYHP